MMTHRNAAARVLLVLLATTAAYSQGQSGKIDDRLLGTFASGPNASAPLFVIFSARPAMFPLAQIPDSAQRRRAVIAALRGSANSAQGVAQALLRARGLAFTPYWVQNAIYVPQADLAVAQALSAVPGVAAVISEPVMSIPQVETGIATSAAGVEWNVSKIGAESVWPTTTGTGVVVASIDTGVRYSHSALLRQYRGYSPATGRVSHRISWKDPTGVCGSVPCDNADHGTHVTGIMVGDDGVSNHIGVAPGARWIACKGCANSSGCLASHIIACAQWLMDPLEDSSGRYQPDIVNNSWGGGQADPWLMGFVDNWRAAGIFPVFSAGNSGPSCGTAQSPGDYPQSVGVGATDEADLLANLSARGPSGFGGVKPDLTAPGTFIRSSIATSNSSYAVFSGTSMASPHVAGTVALIWANQPGLRGNVAATEQLLRSTALPLVSNEACGGTALQSPNNTYGYGRVDAVAAVIGAPPNQPPVVTIGGPLSGSTYPCPALVDFSAQATDAENGDLSSLVTYIDNGGPAFATGATASKSYVCTEAGLHNITAGVTDLGGLPDTDTISINVCKPYGTLCGASSECCSNDCILGARRGMCR